MSSRLLPPPPLTAPIPWNAGPWSSPLIVIEVVCGAGPLWGRPAAVAAAAELAAAGCPALSASAGIRAAVAVAIRRPRPANQLRIGCAAPCSACGRGWPRQGWLRQRSRDASPAVPRVVSDDYDRLGHYVGGR